MEDIKTIEEKITVAEEKEAVNVLDLLLGADSGTIKLPFLDMEITRLSAAFGKPFYIRVEALAPDVYESVQDAAIKIEGKDVNLDTTMLQILTVIESVRVLSVDKDGNRVAGERLLKNKNLMEKFDAPTPKELCRNIFLSGEISNIYKRVAELSGFSDEAVKEVKN